MYVPVPPPDPHPHAVMALPFSDFLVAVAQPVARLLRLPHLPEHFPTLFYAFLAFTALHLYISPFLSSRIFPISYGKLRTPRAVNQWYVLPAGHRPMLTGRLLGTSRWCHYYTSSSSSRSR